MINSLDEAIKHCEEVAEELEKRVKPYQCEAINKKLYEVNKKEWDDCLECAEEHRQLAEWLNELKAYRKAEKKIIENMRAWEKIYAEPLEWNVDDINSIKLAFYQDGKADAYTDCIGICEIAFGEVKADEQRTSYMS